MHGERFDEVARLIEMGASRRRVLKGLVSGLLGLGGTGAVLRRADAQDCGVRVGDPCVSEDSECCGFDDGIVCAGVPGARICANTATCVGGDGPCNPDKGLNCCEILVCNVTDGSDGTCVLAPPVCQEFGWDCTASEDCCDNLVCGDNDTCEFAPTCSEEGDACEVDDDCCDGICCSGACHDIECCTDDDDPNARCPEGTACFEGYCDELGANGANVTIHKATCPTGTADIFGDCHDNALAGVAFTIDVTTVTTDGDGVAGTTVVAGTITVSEDAGTFADYLGAYVYCSDQHSGTILYDGSADSGSVTFAVADGDEVICDWYNITEAEDDDDNGGGTKLPTTGVGPGEGSTEPWLGAAALLGGAAALLAGQKVRGGARPDGLAE